MPQSGDIDDFVNKFMWADKSLIGSNEKFDRADKSLIGSNKYFDKADKRRFGSYTKFGKADKWKICSISNLRSFEFKIYTSKHSCRASIARRIMVVLPINETARQALHLLG